MTEDEKRRLAALEKVEAQMLLIREILGLSPIHDPVRAIEVLWRDGVHEFRRICGTRCDFAHEWRAE